MAQEKKAKSKGYGTTTIILVIVVFVLSLLNGYLYFQLKEYENEYEVLKNEYVALYNRTTLQEKYYDNLTDMYSDLRYEYDQLSNNYKDLLQKHYNLTSEYDDILKYKKEIMLTNNESIVLPIKSNSSYTYKLPFSGYIIMNFTADDDVYVWIGSSMVNAVYFARYPQFPETAENASFIVPVAPDLIVFIGNPNEFNEVRVNFTIKFVY